jgi:hypothetical protein
MEDLSKRCAAASPYDNGADSKPRDITVRADMWR